MLRRYMYLSHAVPGFGTDDLHRLVEKSQQRNARNGVTGLLIFAEGHFMQFIEGPEAAIAQLRSLIQADPDHTDITELRYTMASQRLFDGWALASDRLAGREALSLQVARHLARLEWAGEDLEVLTMLGRFWADFGAHVDLADGQLPRWHASVQSG